MSNFDQLQSLINQLADRGSRKERNALASEAHELLCKIQSAAPPATSEEALDRAYETGAIKALEIYREIRDQKEAPIKKAEIGAAYPVLNGLIHYGQDMISSAEAAVMRHLTNRT